MISLPVSWRWEELNYDIILNETNETIGLFIAPLSFCSPSSSYKQNKRNKSIIYSRSSLIYRIHATIQSTNPYHEWIKNRAYPFILYLSAFLYLFLIDGQSYDNCSTIFSDTAWTNACSMPHNLSFIAFPPFYEGNEEEQRHDILAYHYYLHHARAQSTIYLYGWIENAVIPFIVGVNYPSIHPSIVSNLSTDGQSYAGLWYSL